MSVVQGKFWCFTDFQCREDYSDWGTTYLIYGVETCPSTGKKHHQGYCEFPGNQRNTTLGKKFGCHFERRQGKAEQAIDYCKKEGKWFEFGEKKENQQGKRTDIEQVKEMVNAGARLPEIYDVVTSFQALRFAEKGIEIKEKKRNFKPHVVWYYGPTGTGKTKAAMEEAGEDCWISGKNLRWWQGYDGHENVVFDDFRKDFCTFHELLRILDRTPYYVEVKGGSRQLLAKKIWITCPYAPEDIYEGREDVTQLLRRIDEVKYFGPKFSFENNS